MIKGAILGIFVLLLVIISVRERVSRQKNRERFLSEAKSSPLSQALTNLVGVAGGIYLSLEVITSFTEFRVPDRLQLGGISMEPLAAVSIMIAIVQPFFLRAIDSWRKI